MNRGVDQPERSTAHTASRPLPRSVDGLLPHAGVMRLIRAVLHWDENTIECRATSHRDPDHPLRVGSVLPAVCALEYGAQAMAIHGALIAGQVAPPRVGLLVAAHEFEWRADRLDTIDSELTIRATRLLGSAAQVAYEFEVLGDARSLASGRASVILSVDAQEGR